MYASIGVYVSFLLANICLCATDSNIAPTIREELVTMEGDPTRTTRSGPGVVVLGMHRSGTSGS